MYTNAEITAVCNATLLSVAKQEIGDELFDWLHGEESAECDWQKCGHKVVEPKRRFKCKTGIAMKLVRSGEPFNKIAQDRLEGGVARVHSQQLLITTYKRNSTWLTWEAHACMWSL